LSASRRLGYCEVEVRGSRAQKEHSNAQDRRKIVG
jgi:hypothetical protein